nr:class I SAM-dependent RNA methyltransferase [Spirochaetota bacterium]
FDLYCGIGLITLFVGHFSSETVGVELSKSSIKDALHNLEINGGASNVKFIESAVEEVVDKLGRADVVIIDPPRKGIDQKSLDSILDISPKKIIYSSCKPQTMARDISLLSNDYKIKELILVDMFPQTHHLELLALLEKK